MRPDTYAMTACVRISRVRFGARASTRSGFIADEDSEMRRGRSQGMQQTVVGWVGVSAPVGAAADGVHAPPSGTAAVLSKMLRGSPSAAHVGVSGTTMLLPHFTSRVAAHAPPLGAAHAQ